MSDILKKARINMYFSPIMLISIVDMCGRLFIGTCFMGKKHKNEEG